MSKAFKNQWKEMHKQGHPLLDLQNLDFIINDITVRMTGMIDYDEWRNLYHQREALQAQRNALAQTLV